MVADSTSFPFLPYTKCSKQIHLKKSKTSPLAGYYVACWNQGLEEMISECVLERNNDNIEMCFLLSPACLQDFLCSCLNACFNNCHKALIKNNKSKHKLLLMVRLCYWSAEGQVEMQFTQSMIYTIWCNSSADNTKDWCPLFHRVGTAVEKPPWRLIHTVPVSNAMFIKPVLGTIAHSLPAQFQCLSWTANSSDSDFCDMNTCL